MRTKVYRLMDCYENVRYIGKTRRSLSQRLAVHLQIARYEKDQSYWSHKSCWLRSLDYKPIIELIIEVDGNGCEEEIFQIARHKQMGYDLTNATTGGEGGYLRSEESKERQRQKMIGRKATEEHRIKLREHAASFWTPEQCSRWKEQMKSWKPGRKAGGVPWNKGKSYKPKTARNGVPCSSKFIGVSFIKTADRWISSCRIKGKQKTIGFFKTEEEAVQARINYLQRISL